MDNRAISLAALASMALAGCGGNSSADLVPPLGTPAAVPIPINAASLTGGLTAGEATFTFNQDGSIEVGLPDGGRIVLTEDDIGESGDFVVVHNRKGDEIDGGELTVYETADGDRIEIALGTDLADDFIFATARLDRADDGLEGFDTYGVTGNETDPAALPQGGAEYEYEGAFLASVMVEGEILSDTLTGTVKVEADFGDALVDVEFKGGYEQADGPGKSPEFKATFDDLPVTGAQYAGAMDSGHMDLPGGDRIRLDGDLIGAFYGPDAEATAGVFTAFEESGKDPDIDIAGGYWAWDEDLIDDLDD